MVDVKVTTEGFMKAQKVAEVLLYSFFKFGAEWEGCIFHPAPRPLYPREIEPVHIVQKAGWAPGPVWVWKFSPPTAIRSPDRPARSE